MSSIDKQNPSKDRFRKLVGDNRLADAVKEFEVLSNTIDSNTYRNIIIGVISQYEEFKQFSISGTLTAEQKTQSTAKIRQTLLNLADQIPEEYLPSLAIEKDLNNRDKWEQKVNRLFLSSSLGFFILCILLVVGSIGYYTYMYSHALHAEHEHNLSFSGFVPFWASFGGLNASGVMFLVAKWLK